MMNYSVQEEDGRTGCQLTNQAKRESDEQRKMEREEASERTGRMVIVL